MVKLAIQTKVPLFRLPQKRKMHTGTPNINRKIKIVFNIQPLFFSYVFEQMLSPGDKNAYYGLTV
jgi:hypothetical protein